MQIPDAAKLTSAISANELAEFLIYAQTLTTAFIYIHPVAFPTTKDRANWLTYRPDLSQSSTYDELWRAAPAAVNSLALFTTTTVTWVARPWWDDPWHCWGAVFFRPRRELHVLIFDCDPAHNRERRRDVLLSTQQRLLHYLEVTKKRRLRSIWYGNAGITPATDQCVLQTVTWMNTMATQLDSPFLGPGDPRLAGFSELTAR